MVLLRLDLAIKRHMPDSGITARTLQREARRGRLVVTRIAGKDFVTEAALQEFIDLCQTRRADPGSISVSAAADQACTLSETERLSALQASALTEAQALKKRSPAMQRKRLRRAPANVIRAGSRFQKC